MRTDPPTRPSRLRRLRQLAVVDVTPLRRHREFRLLFVGRTVSTFGTMISSVAVPFQIYALTHSSLAVGLLGLFEIGPILALAFLGGALADAHDRRRLVLFTELALTAMSAVLWLNAALPHPHLWVLYAAITGITALEALQSPSLTALGPRLVDRDELAASIAVMGTTENLSRIVGPALAGILISTTGLPSTYGIDVVTFAVSLVTLQLMQAVPPPPDAERPSIRRVVEGLRYARSRPELMGTYLIDMVAMFFGMPTALFPAIASQYKGAGVLGFLYAAPAVGSFLATVTSGWTGRVHRLGLAVVLAAGCWGLAVLGFGLAGALPLLLVFLALAGAADELSAIFRSVLWNATIPDALRGRLAGIELISYASGPTLGNVESGVVASLFGVRASIISGGVLCVAGVAGLALALPLLLAYDNRVGVTSTDEGL
jgi:MFS family permease